METKQSNHATMKTSERKIARRRFLRKALYAGAGLAVAAPVVAIVPFAIPNIQEFGINLFLDRRSREAIDGETEFLKGQYGFDVKFGGMTIDEVLYYDWQPSNASDRVAALKILRRELAKYPPEFVRWLYIQEIKLLRTLYNSNKPIAGLHRSIGSILIATSNNHFKGEKDLCLTVTSSSIGVKDYSNLLHHELYHRADFREGVAENEDDEWISFNLDGKHAYMRDEYKKAPCKRPRGFAARYGLRNSSEDQATVAAALMTKTDNIHQIAESDSILAEKLKTIKSDYRRWSKGLMGERYWIDLASGLVNEDYW